MVSRKSSGRNLNKPKEAEMISCDDGIDEVQQLSPLSEMKTSMIIISAFADPSKDAEFLVGRIAVGEFPMLETGLMNDCGPIHRLPTPSRRFARCPP